MSPVPLTARAVAGEIDATACTDDTWSAIHRVRPRATLSCRGCSGSLQAKVSVRGMRFFAHDRHCDVCPTAGETPLHRELKLAIINAARARGHEATPELAGEGWRTDVLVTSSCGRKVAFEVQLVAMTAAEGRERTSRMVAGGVDEVVWLTPKIAPWLDLIPSIRVQADDEGVLHVHNGCASWSEDHWVTPEPFSLSAFVHGIANGRIATFRPEWYSEHVPLSNGRTGYIDASVVWIKPADHAAWEATEKKWREEERREAGHRERIVALVERRRRLLPEAIRIARTETGGRVWVGDPPVTPARGGATDLCVGGGISIWIGVTRPSKRWGVVCPVASRITGAVWHRLSEVRVFAADPEERDRIARALSRPVEIIGA